MPISIIRAQPADAETLVRLQIAAFHHDSVLYPEVELGGPPGYDSVEQMLEKIQQDETYKIVEGEVCIGGLVVFGKAAGQYHLDVIFLDPVAQNRGLGTLAMQFLERTYLASVWTLDTPTWAVRNQHFYEKFGFVKLYEFDHGDGTPLIAYEKRAAASP